MPENTEPPLFPSDVVDTPAAVREAVVKTSAPCVILVLEMESVPRYHVIASPEELPSLERWLHTEPRAAATWSSFHSIDEARGQSELLERRERQDRWEEVLNPVGGQARRKAMAPVVEAIRASKK